MKIQLIAASVIATVGLAGCATSPGYGGGGYNNSGYNNGGYGNNSGYNQGRCADCGIVTRINAVQSGRTAPSATGAILGGIVGALPAMRSRPHRRQPRQQEHRRRRRRRGWCTGGQPDPEERHQRYV